MRVGLVFLLGWGLLAGCRERGPNSLPPAVAKLEGTWLHSVEESRDDTLVYRANFYNFPPHQRRTGFRIGPFGRFTQFDLAPAGGLIARPGTWVPDGPSFLRIHLHEGQQPDYTLELLSLKKKVLRLRHHAVADKLLIVQ